jgi:transcriptional regulator with XRE-family HTH domain
VTTTAVTAPANVGGVLRLWRERRRLTQLDLASKAEISARHLSFLENGRSKPSSSMLLRLAEHLDLPLRERNSLLLVGGFAPAFPAGSLHSPPMAAVNDAIERVLAAHMPFPAVVIDAGWDMIAANDAIGLMIEGCSPQLLEPPVNVLRLSLHPDGMAPRITNLHQWRAHLLARLAREVETTADPRLSELYRELSGYPVPPGDDAEDTRAILVPLHYRVRDQQLNFFSMTTIFGTPRDVTLAELAIESFYPADPQTAEFFQTASPEGVSLAG